MLILALKMLIGDRAKYIGIIFALTFASFIIIQQASIFTGLMTRTYGFITDTSHPDIWVMDPKVQYIDDIKPLKSTQLLRVRGIEGVSWAVPYYKGLIKARLTDGNFQSCNVIGIDDATLIGGPPQVLEGKIEDLRLSNAVIVNKVGAEDKLANEDPVTGDKYPLQVGQVLELNDKRAVVVGICSGSRTFQSQPVIYTTFDRAISYAPYERKLMSFVLVKAEKEMDPLLLCQRIHAVTGLAAYTKEQFIKLTIDYYVKYTGIPINFGVAVILGFIIGIAITGQIFYNFTLDNLRYFGTFKAMGASHSLLIQMILLQALLVGGIGWGLGIGGASFFGFCSMNTELSFRLTKELFIGSGFCMLFICMIAALISIKKVLKLEPAIVFKS